MSGGRRQTSKPLGKQVCRRFSFAVSSPCKSRVSGLCGDCLALLGCAPGLSSIARSATEDAHARRFSAFGSGLIWYFSSPVFEAETPERAGFFRSPDPPRELREDDPCRSSPQNSPFGEFRGHADFELKRENFPCPDSPNGEKCRPILRQIRTSCVPDSDLEKKPLSATPARPRHFINARAFIASEIKSKNGVFSRKNHLKSHSARYIFIESPTVRLIKR